MTTRDEAVQAFQATTVHEPESWVDEIEADADRHPLDVVARVWRETIAPNDDAYAHAIETTIAYLGDR